MDRRPCSIAAISRAATFAVAIGALLGLAGRAEAQNAQAEALFNDGAKLMAAGQYAKACDAFEASNRVESRAGTLISLGECREQNQQLASAWSAYKDALKRVKDPRKREFANAKVKAIEPRLSYLTVTVAADHKLDGLAVTRNGEAFDGLLWNRALPVDGGDYVIAASAPGFVAWQTTAHVPVEGGKIAVELPKLDAAPAGTPPTVAVAAPGPSAPVPIASVHATAAPEGMFTPRRKLAVVAGGVAVAGAVVGIALGVSARGKKNDAYADCNAGNASEDCAKADAANALIRSARSRALGANISFAVAAAAAIGAGVLWFTGGPSEQPRVSVAPTVAPGNAGLVVVGAF
jgi:tetratricopeptide (TPR) repeat protein